MSPDSPTLRRPDLASLICVAAAMAAVGCSKKLDMTRVKAEIQKGIAQQSGVTVHWVECPESRKAQPGDRFECRAGLDGGAVTVDVVQDDYANAKWTQREILLDPRAVEVTIAARLKEAAGREIPVRCPDVRRPSVPGTRFACEGDGVGKRPGFEIAVVVATVQGQIDWTVPKGAINVPPGGRGRAGGPG